METSNKGISSMKMFNPKKMKEYFSALIMGCRRSGKTYILNYILSQIWNEHKFDSIYLFSPTAKVQLDHWQFVKPEFKIEDLSDETILKLYNERLSINERYQKHPEDFENKPNCLIIFDDMLADSKGKSIFYSQAVNKLFFAGRHALISVVVLSQHFKAVGTILRNNVDYFLYYRTMKQDDRLSVCGEYLCFDDDKENKKKGLQLMSDITATPYQCMVIDKVGGQYATAFNEYVYKFLAPEKYSTDNIKLFPIKRAHEGGGKKLEMTINEPVKFYKTKEKKNIKKNI